MRSRRLPSPSVTARRLSALERALAEAWAYPEGLAIAAERLGDFLPGVNGAIYFRERDGGLGPIGANIGSLQVRNWEEWPVPTIRDDLFRTVVYPFRGPYHLADRFVNTTASFVNLRERYETYQRDLLGRNGLQHHLRVTVYRRSKMHGWFGIFANTGDSEFTAEEARLFDRALGPIRAAERVAALTRYGSAQPPALQIVLEAFERPAWLVARGGAVASANTVARNLGRDAARAAVAAAGAIEPQQRWAVSRLSIAGEPLTLVIGNFASSAKQPSLPPALATVADALAQGLSDKELAATLDMPLSTVRTYVQRVYARLGVHGRVELARLWLGNRDAKPASRT